MVLSFLGLRESIATQPKLPGLEERVWLPTCPSGKGSYITASALNRGISQVLTLFHSSRIFFLTMGQLSSWFSATLENWRYGDFHFSTADKTLPANAGDMGSNPDLGRYHMPWGNWAHVPQLLRPHSRACKPQLLMCDFCSVWGPALVFRGPGARPANQTWPPLLSLITSVSLSFRLSIMGIRAS